MARRAGPLTAGSGMAVDAGIPETPAFVYDERRILARLGLFQRLCRASGARLLYSIKAQPLTGLLALIRPGVSGFAASSLFEARLAAEALHPGDPGAAALHLTTPGLRAADIAELGRLCTAISFNSLEQCRRFLPGLNPAVAAGIRVNPGLSAADDPRYDPCRPASKLGVPLDELRAALAAEPALAARIDGLHFHTHFDGREPGSLRDTLARIEALLGPRLQALRWINLGGGYNPRDIAQADAFGAAIRAFRERCPLAVWLEPGNAIVGGAGSLATTVVDTFRRDGQAVAVLDTGVHHLPAVFEYQRPPCVREARPDAPHAWLLAGSSCLAGDLFGVHRFAEPLRVGDRLHVTDVGAYALVKASRFNGHDLPSVWLRERAGRLRLLKAHGYAEYRRQWTTPASPAIRSLEPASPGLAAADERAPACS